MSPQTCVGVDVGGNKIAVALGTCDGRILAEAKMETRPEAGPANAFERISEWIDRQARDNSLAPQAIGVGVPGLVDPQAGVIEFLPNLPSHWYGFRAVDFLRESTGKPAFLLNDARLATLGEFTFGADSGTADMLIVTIGTGIGGGLILDGRLRLGLHGGAGEVGHQTILPDGLPCTCGNRGCLETLINGRSLSAEGVSLAESGAAPHLAEIVHGDWSRVTPKEMCLAVERGDQAVLAVIERAAKYLGIGIANAITITAVKQVVLCGGVAALGDLLLEPVRAIVRERVRMFPSDGIRIRCSTLGERVGALGGIALAFQNGVVNNFEAIDRAATVLS